MPKELLLTGAGLAVFLTAIVLQAIVGPLLVLWYSRRHGRKNGRLTADVERAVQKYVAPLTAKVLKNDIRTVQIMKRLSIWVDPNTDPTIRLSPEDQAAIKAFAEADTPVDRKR